MSMPPKTMTCSGATPCSMSPIPDPCSLIPMVPFQEALP